MQTYQFHPAAEKFGKPWSEARMNRVVADMKKHGFDRTKPIFLYQGKIIIGCNRYRACQIAGVEPRIEELKLRKGETLEDAVKRDNLDRNQYTPEEEAALRAERIEEVVAERQAGGSLRAIAEKHGVNEKTIRNDLEAATAEGSAVEPPNGKVTGQDGRTRTANPKKPQEKFVCETCRRKGIHVNCPDCAAGGGGKRLGNKSTPAAPKNGAEKFDWKGADTAFGPVVRSLDKLAHAYPDRKKEVEKMRKLLSECYALFTEAKKELTGAKK